MNERRPCILLVDDEVQVVTGLRRVMARTAKEFEVETAVSADEALAVLSRVACAVIVSDLQMPGMNGIELLETVARNLPMVGRVLLSGTAEADAATRALATAHRFLCKPCDIKSLVQTCRELHRHGIDATGVGGIVALAIDRSTMDQARAAMTISRQALVGVINGHPALAAAVLHVVGSEFLGSRTEAVTLDDALGFMGHAGFERLLGSGALLGVVGEAAHPIVAHTTRARARVRAVVHSGGSPLDALAALLLDVDQLGSSDPACWAGLRREGHAAALLGLWGAPSALLERVAAFED